MMAYDTETLPPPLPPSNPYSRAANSYKTNSYQGLSQRELMGRIFQKVINHLYMARDAFEAQNLEYMVEQNGKAIHILDVLREEMIGSDALKDPEAAGPARQLIRLYGEWIARIANVLQNKPPQDAFNALIEDMKPIYQAWMPPKEAPVEEVSGMAEAVVTSTAG